MPFHAMPSCHSTLSHHMAPLHHSPQLPPDVNVLLKRRQQQVLVRLQAVVPTQQARTEIRRGRKSHESRQTGTTKQAGSAYCRAVRRGRSRSGSIPEGSQKVRFLWANGVTPLQVVTAHTCSGLLHSLLTSGRNPQDARERVGGV